MNVRFNLICWSCGQSVTVEAERFPSMAFEVAVSAEAIGWLGAFDMNRSRMLVFCSEECCDAQRTKRGTFRLRPKAVAAKMIKEAHGG